MPKGVPAAGKRVLSPLANARAIGPHRHELRLPDLPAPLNQAARKFEEAVGGRDALVAHLTHLQLSFEEQLIVGAIADPNNARHPLARICQFVDITFGDLLQLFRRAGFAKAQVEAMHLVWQHTPKLAEDVMLRALPHYLPCSACRGRGLLRKRGLDEKGQIQWTEEQCEACGAEGQVLKQPQLEGQRLGLELSGLLDTQGSTSVQLNVVEQHNTMKVLQQFAAASDALLYPQAPPARDEPVEAEVLERERGPEPAAPLKVGHHASGGDDEEGG